MRCAYPGPLDQLFLLPLGGRARESEPAFRSVSQSGLRLLPSVGRLLWSSLPTGAAAWERLRGQGPGDSRSQFLCGESSIHYLPVSIGPHKN